MNLNFRAEEGLFGSGGKEGLLQSASEVSRRWRLLTKGEGVGWGIDEDRAGGGGGLWTMEPTRPPFPLPLPKTKDK